MPVLFYFITIVAIIGWLLGKQTLWKRLFYSGSQRQFYSLNTTPRIWVSVHYVKTESVKIKPRVYMPARRLAKDIEIVTMGKVLAESYAGYSYRDILQTLTKEQVNDIREMRSFLK